ncbi:LysR family transcriptional regulator [Novosphingobium rosa]|uniref:LysR family transcriptional regulator n=1 Tax=Novosphingobium rosa TaxID=76978 RepID=UPI00083364EB|nr:LysR family transcriptional regulator [Novosphingobium rosa]
MVDRLPSLRGIETFVCVAELLNLRLASERLHVTVSAISHRIHVLEEELGILLFHRGGRHLRLSAEGEAFLNDLRPGIALMNEATARARSIVARPVLRVTAPAQFHDQWLLPHLDDFLALNPGVRVELLSIGRRRSAATDVSVLPLTSALLRDGAEPLIESAITPMCSPAFLAAHPISAPGDLLALPLIDTVPSMNGWRDWFASVGIDEEVPPLAVGVDHQILLCGAAMRGLGVTLGIRALVADLVAQGLLVEPLPIASGYTIGFGTVVNESGQLRLARSFVRWLQETFRNSSTVSQNSGTSAGDETG